MGFLVKQELYFSVVVSCAVKAVQILQAVNLFSLCINLAAVKINCKAVCSWCY